MQFKLDGANLGAEDTTAPYSVTWNSTTATNGAHTLTALARDAADNTTTSAGVSVTVSNAASCPQTPLNVSAATSPGGFAYYLPGSFGTPADNQNFPTQSILRLFEGSLELGPAHSLHADIRDLGQGRFSHWSATNGTFEAIFFSASDNTDPRTNGRSYAYCVPGAAPDTTPPTVSITAPASGATVSGTAVTVSATASDNVRSRRRAVQARRRQPRRRRYHRALLGHLEQHHRDQRRAHAYRGRARCGRQYHHLRGRHRHRQQRAPDTTPPTVSITAPASGATVSGTAVTVSATASDNVGVAGVQFKLDGANLGAEDTTAPYSVTWNSTTATNGAHTLTALARDAANNMTTSAGVSVTVNNAASCPQTPLNVSAATSPGGFAYYLPGSFGTPADNQNFPTQSILRLFEGSLELGPAHSLHRGHPRRRTGKVQPLECDGRHV